MKQYYLSLERHKELKAELDTLKKEKRIEVAEHLKRAKEYGDLSENSEYAEAREEQSRIEGRIFELEDLMKHATIIKKGGGGGVVQVGSTVTVKKNGSIFTYAIVGSSESNPEEKKVSNESPIGRALLGKKVGDKANVQAPSGVIVYTITKIE
ncbi:MAG: transcription elongation factor GreA [Patescibacteria group bacterium]